MACYGIPMVAVVFGLLIVVSPILIVGCSHPGGGGGAEGAADSPTPADTGEGVDADQDGFWLGDDCDDTDPEVWPGRAEVCADGVDQDCDGVDPRCRMEATVALADQAARIVGDVDGGVFGYDVGRAGDVNADGYADVLVSGTYSSDGGSWFLFHGPIDGQVREADAALVVRAPTGMSEYSPCGRRVSGGGDLDGDGAPDQAMMCEGSLYVFSGGTTGDLGLESASRTYAAPAYNDEGYLYEGEMSFEGDVTGDGEVDLVVEAADDYWQYGALRAWVFAGPIPSALAAADAVASLGFEEDPGRASALHTASDIDGDGIQDLVVSGNRDVGAAVCGYQAVYLGPLLGNLSSSDAAFQLIQAPAAIAYGSWAMAAAGDVNGDGTPDLLVGGYQDADGAPGGQAWLISGTERGFATSDVSFASFTGDEPGDSLGRAVASTDLDGDGAFDVLLGADGVDADSVSRMGKVGIWYGPVSGSHALVAADVAVKGDNGGAGWSLAAVGDLDGDTLDDVVVSAPVWSDGATSPGAVYPLWGGL